MLIFFILGLLSSVSNLHISEEDSCTLQLSWVDPYSLKGVPVDKYTINITDENGVVLRSDITKDTKYNYNSYNLSSLGETLEVVVAAVNGAGTGNPSSIQSELHAVC